MATGFPTKSNWAAGDVLTAAQMDDLAGTVNLLSNASAASGSVLLSNVAGTSFAYQAPYSQQPVLNSAMQIWQRGTSFTTTNTTYLYGADRWDIYSGTTGRTYSRQATGDTTNLPNIQYCQRVARNSGNTNTTDLYLWSDFESVNSIPFAGKTVTLSFYARAGANYSATSSALTARLVSGTGTDQNYIHTGYSGQANVINQTPTFTTTWQRFQYTATVGTTATQLGIFFGFTPVGTAGANDYYEITGIQLELGSIATPFHTYAATYQGELAACQRYYEDSRDTTGSAAFQGNPGSVWCGGGGALGSNLARGGANFKVTKRVTPTVTIYDLAATSSSVTIDSGGTPTNGKSASVDYQGLNAFRVSANPGVSYNSFAFYYTASAEL